MFTGTPTLMRVIPCSNVTHAGVGSLVTYGNQLFVGRNGVARIEVYDTTDWSLRSHLLIDDLGDYVRGLASCDFNKCLYVSDCGCSCVHKVDLSTYKVALKWSVADRPWGLSVNSARNVLVACCGAGKVQEYSSVGSLIREIYINGGSPYHGIQLLNGQTAVSQAGDLHRVCVIGVDGQIVKSYGNSMGSADGLLAYPYCLGVDKQGGVLVADYANHRIMALNSLLTVGHELSLPAVDKVMFPASVWFDDLHGRLYIGEGRGDCRVLVFDNVTGISALFNDYSVNTVLGD